MRFVQRTILLLICVPNVDAAGFQATTEQAASNEFAAPVLLSAGGEPIDVGGFAAPYFGDFNNDGKRDLLIGQLEYGRLRIYPNIGTDERPKFDTFDWFRAGGRIAGVPSGCRVGFTPQLVDYDGDGLLDIVTGSFNGGLLYVFRRNQSGTYSNAEVLEDKNGQVQFLDSKYNSTLFVYDWDSDGAIDLITGRRAAWVRNEGTTAHPIYAQQLPLFEGSPRIPYGAPTVADWDGDGLHDLLIAGQDVIWYRNSGEPGRPILDRPQVLISNGGAPYLFGSDQDANREQPAVTYSICVTDFDNDGRLDILLGDWYTQEKVVTQEQTEPLKLARAKRSKFAHGFHRLMRESSRVKSRLTRISSFQTALQEWDELSSHPFDGPQAAQHRLVRHGGVWFYRRLPTDP